MCEEARKPTHARKKQTLKALDVSTLPGFYPIPLNAGMQRLCKKKETEQRLVQTSTSSKKFTSYRARMSHLWVLPCTGRLANRNPVM